jgi:hypothetical protein
LVPIAGYLKIAALYIRSFLKYQPFYLDIPKETKDIELCMVTKCPNEYFSIPFLEAIFRAWNDDFDGLLKLDMVYRDNFIKQLYRYTKDIGSLDPASLSNIIFLIEQRYFIRSATRWRVVPDTIRIYKREYMRWSIFCRSKIYVITYMAMCNDTI